MMYNLRTYLRRRALRKQDVDIFAAAKAWGSPHPIEIMKFCKPYVWCSGLCLPYNLDRKNVYVNVAPVIHRKALQRYVIVIYPNVNHGEVYKFSLSDILFSLKREKYRDVATYNYSHECAHKFLSIKNEESCDHEVQFGIVLAILLMRLWLNPDPAFKVYNFQDERQACYCFKKYGNKPTLMALRKICLEAACNININYTNVLQCCEEAMSYSYIVRSEKMIIKWAAFYKKQIIKKNLERWGSRVLWIIIFCCIINKL